ncbi:MAG: hypothetical protein OXQ29_03755 [Rhodospirillaceae bacterium]|nr:hypothetical protein [Rhodospirillaceae bacterium]
MAAAVLSALAVCASAQTFGDGTHLVGIEIDPGTYRASESEYCRWERLANLSGEIGSRLGFGYRPVVEIKPTDKAFSAEGCGTWTLLSAELEPVLDFDAATVIEQAARMLLVGIVVSLNHLSYDASEVAERTRYIHASLSDEGYPEAHQVAVRNLLDFFEQVARQ